MVDNHILFPPPVIPGDCIGLFSPSGPVREQQRFDDGIRLLHKLGYRTRVYPPVQVEHPYLASDDESRALEFQTMWNDPEVHAMMAVRGGYGCLRMMPFLDMDQLPANQKLIIGFSDLTVLLNSLAERLSIVTLHGPVLTSLAITDKPSINSLIELLNGNFFSQRMYSDVEILRGGVARGVLRGGNLTTIAHLFGTPWDILFKDAVLLLEDTGEPMYKIDRILTQLYISGRLENIAGLVLGTFDCGSDEEANMQLRDEVWERVLELTAHFDYPVWGNFPIGHCEKNHSIPIGASVTIDSSRCSMTINAEYI